MRLIITAILLTAIVVSPGNSHVLMPLSYEQRQAAAQLVVIAETIPIASTLDKGDVIEFRVLSTLKGQRKSILKVSRSTMIQEEMLNCCTLPGRYILFLTRSRKGLYESVNGNYGVVRLAE